MNKKLSTNQKLSKVFANILGIVVIFAMAFPVTAVARAAPASPFLGQWRGTDPDGSEIRLTIAGRPDGPFQITWTESYIGFCGGEAGIVRGTGWLNESNPNLLEADLLLKCFTTDVTLDFHLVWRYHPTTDTLSSRYDNGVVTIWRRPGGQQVLPPTLNLRVNYGHDWVESFYEGGHTAWITVTESDGVTVKATAELVTEPKWYWGDETGFQSLDGVWFDADGNPMENLPDIQPYGWVYGWVDNGASAQVQIGEISGAIDLADNSISGTINALWFSGEQVVDVECFDWGSGQEPPFDNAYGGSILPNDSESYACSWEEWDIQPGQDVGVGYFDPDGNWVANAFNITPLWLYVDYEYPGGVEGDYELGHTVQVIVLDSEGNTKATATVETREMPHWGGAPGFGVGDSDWIESPPDIQPGDIVRAVVDDGFLTTEVLVGEITGMIDLDTNSVSGTIYAPWKGDSVNVLCSPWGGPEGVNGIETTVNPNGEDTFTCTWDSAEWDIQPGEAVGVYYWAGIGLHSIANAILNPWIMAFPEANQIFGYGWPIGSDVSLKINGVSIGDPVQVQGAPWDENDIMAFFDLNELPEPLDLIAGDEVWLSGSGIDRIYTIQNLTVTNVDWEANTVFGTADSGAEVHAWVHEYGHDVWLQVADDELWAAIFEPESEDDDFHLQPGMCGRAEIRGEGYNSTNVDWCIPNPEIRVWLGSQRVEGYQWPLGESISLSIDGNFFEPQQVQGDEFWTYVSFEIGDWVLEPGQEIVMTGAGIEKTHIILPVSITSVDTALNLVEGIATSDGRIILCIYNGGCEPPIEVSADISGYWQKAYGDQFNIQPGFGMDATEFDGDGDGTSFDYWVPSFVLQANAGWVKSTISIVGGTEITITAYGEVATADLNEYPTSISGPDGQVWNLGCGQYAEVPPPCAMDNEPYGALVGKIGSEGEPFLIGSSLTFTPTASGELYLAVNDNLNYDNLNYYNDNSGEFWVLIQ